MKSFTKHSSKSSTSISNPSDSRTTSLQTSTSKLSSLSLLLHLPLPMPLKLTRKRKMKNIILHQTPTSSPTRQHRPASSPPASLRRGYARARSLRCREWRGGRRIELGVSFRFDCVLLYCVVPFGEVRLSVGRHPPLREGTERGEGGLWNGDS